jgi:hypothetical protein
LTVGVGKARRSIATFGSSARLAPGRTVRGRPSPLRPTVILPHRQADGNLFSWSAGLPQRSQDEGGRFVLRRATVVRYRLGSGGQKDGGQKNRNQLRERRELSHFLSSRVFVSSVPVSGVPDSSAAPDSADERPGSIGGDERTNHFPRPNRRSIATCCYQAFARSRFGNTFASGVCSNLHNRDRRRHPAKTQRTAANLFLAGGLAFRRNLRALQESRSCHL